MSIGVPPAGSGSRASHEAGKPSSPEASIPNASGGECKRCRLLASALRRAHSGALHLKLTPDALAYMGLDAVGELIARDGAAQ